MTPKLMYCISYDIQCRNAEIVSTVSAFRHSINFFRHHSINFFRHHSINFFRHHSINFFRHHSINFFVITPSLLTPCHHHSTNHHSPFHQSFATTPSIIHHSINHSPPL